MHHRVRAGRSRSAPLAALAFAALAVAGPARAQGPDTQRPAPVSDLDARVPAAAGRVTRYAPNPRYLQDAAGRPFAIVGFGNEIRNPPAVLAQLAGRVNYNRAYAVGWLRTWDPDDYGLGCPWPIAGGRADMDTWNETYWSNLRDFLGHARDAGFTVGLTIWDGHSDLPGGKNGASSIWNADGNLQGVQWDYDAGALAQFPNPSRTGGARERLVHYQRRFVDRLLQEIAPFPNVLLELDNETSGVAPAWWLWWADHILAAGADYVIATTWQADETIPDAVFASDPRLHMKSYHARDDASISAVRWAWGKVVVADADDDCADLARTTARRLAWRALLRGGHWNDFVCADTPFPAAAKVADYGRLIDFLATRGVALWDMTPRGDLVTSGLAMVREGSAYLVHTEAPVTVDLTAATGSLAYEWYDPRTGTTAQGGPVAGGAPRAFSPPASGDFVLWIHR